MPDTHTPIGLPALEARLREDLEWLGLPAQPWVKTQQHGDTELLDVAIVGAGMAGMAAAAELHHLGVRSVLFDQSEPGFEGPWATTARMQTLRSPKQLAGPALGLPALTFRAWYQARFGLAQWQALDKIPRLQWAEYLRWYRQVLNLDVRNQHRIASVQPTAEGFVRLLIDAPDGLQEVLARHVVLATGRDGMGGPWVPDLALALPRQYWAHSADGLQDAWFTGKRVAVIGGGASAMDAAGTALEAGAVSVDMLVRRRELPRINKGKGAGSPGMTHGYWRLPDAWKWQIREYLNAQQTPPPRGSTLRVARHANARLLLDNALEAVELDSQGQLQVRTSQANLVYDFIVFATGFRTDLDKRPEFAPFAPYIRRWSERFPLPADQLDSEAAQLPDLGPLFEFLPREPGACPGLERIHCFNYPAALTYGGVSGDIPAISDGAKRIAQGLAGQLFNEDIEYHFRAMQDYADPELLGDEWQAGRLRAGELRT
ncbi:flavoprotein [Pseudomonas sp. StFLB209]|uniref:flavin-containing monooxygenase n=1 Tax=Pseudomonas sp. StFLB209 TaxID=1028989 RepID=UPI0004F8012B|nr:NAD(P)/FAD-dependent oxidoreductase [Pseudomonas sp. StFLB209]BAP41604.1 flavoprotein [Pseudomonas sp. StFLB209]